MNKSAAHVAERDYDPIHDAVLRFSAEVPLTSENEPSDYLLGVQGTLYKDAQSSVKLAQIWLRIVQYGRVINDRESLFDVCDCVDQSVYEHADAVFDLAKNDLRHNVFDGLNGIDVMMIESLSVEPAYRGRGLGLHCIKRAIDAFGAGMAGVVLKPFPPQFCHGYEGDSPELYVGFETDFKRATRKLQRYYRTLGFRPAAPRSAFFVLDLTTTLPAIPEFGSHHADSA